MSAIALEPGAILRDTYQLTRVIGRGGMGIVYEAQHRRLPQRLAVKVLSDAASGSAIARFRREAEIASGLGHPNIVRVLDFDALPDGRPYMVMDLLGGVDLAEALKGGAMPLGRVRGIVRQVGAALAAAHRSGVVHRDLKPANIFLTSQERGGDLVEHVTVLDFGVSKVYGATAYTQSQAIVGTPQYMAPEQAMGDNDDVTALSDQFALGCVAYEMLAGQPPFSGDSLAKIVYRVCHTDPPPLASLGLGVEPAVSNAIARAMAKNPRHRFASIGDFVAELTGAPLELADSAVGPELALALEDTSAAPAAATKLERPSGRSETAATVPSRPRGDGAASEAQSPPQLRTPRKAPWIVGGTVAAVAVAIATWRLAMPAARVAAVSDETDAPKEAAAPSAMSRPAQPALDTEPSDANRDAREPLPALSVSITGPDGGKTSLEFAAGKSQIWIGRGDDVDIVLDSPEVSRIHAGIESGDQGLVVRDLGSNTGVRVNASEVVEQVLADRDIIGIGEFQLAVHIVGPSATSSTPARKVTEKTADRRDAPETSAAVARDLAEAEGALAAGQFERARRLAERAIAKVATPSGFRVIVLSYCAEGNLGSAKDWARRLSGNARTRILRECRSKYDLDIDP